MPWTPADAKRHKKGLSPKQARQWAHVANGMLKSCLDRGGSMSSCEARAIRAANSAVGAPTRPTKNDTLLHIQTSLTTQPRRQVYRGEEYLVCDCVMAIAGVLNLALLTPEALVPTDWQYTPVVIDHPADAQGLACSARHPSVLASCGVGQVFNARLGQGQRGTQRVPSLVSELWINRGDALRCGTKAMDVLGRLERGQPVECSTAFFSEGFVENGEFEGQPFQEVFTRIRPDHLALLPDTIGACSLADGCGAMRLNQEALCYEHVCACADPSACQCHEGLPMPETPSLSYLQRFWHVVQDFVQRESPTTQEEHEGEPLSTPEDPEAAAEETLTDEKDEEDEDAEVTFADLTSADPDLTAEETAMPTTEVIKRRVNALIANPRTHWSEDDRHMLESQNEAFLIRLEHQPLAPAPMPDAGPGEPTTMEEALQAIPVHLRETMRAATDAYQKRKNSLIEVLLANKHNPFPREDLEAMHADRLEKMVIMSGEPLPGQPVTAAANYNGRRMPHLRIVTQEGEEDQLRPPPLPSTMDLVVEEQKKRGIRF